MSWIERIGYEQATGRLRAIYDRIKGPRGELDNILTVHSLRPHTLTGHMASTRTCCTTAATRCRPGSSS